MNINDKIKNIRNLMKKHEMSAYIIPSFDCHQSEYVADYFKARAWISGFTGSAGTVVVTLNQAILWTDGRYFIQAAKELEGSEIILYKIGQPSVPNFIQFLKDNLVEGNTVGFDGSVIPVGLYKDMKESFSKKGILIDSSKDLVSSLWTDRPAIPRSKIFVHKTSFAGKSVEEKLTEIRNKMREEHVNYYVLSSLDDIAWTLNLRGNDIPYSPVFLSYLLIDYEGAALYIDENKLTPEVIEEMNKVKVTVADYHRIFEVVSSLDKGNILYDPNKTNVKIFNAINHTLKKVENRNITTDLKAVKNETEIENFMNCSIRDGVAMVRFIKYLKENVNRGEITEISASDYLTELRRKGENFVSPSFETIAGYKEHAAMMHYSAKKETNYKLKAQGMFLVDSGGQYFDGTTDITRTIVLGSISDEEKKDFTLVVKANLDLAMAKFLYGTTGSNLDIVARTPLWNEGIDYKCGTGHGVGFFLNVHEGPQNLSQRPNNIVLEPGMNITDEPGVYKEGKHGIRIENLLFVVNDKVTEFGGKFMKFEVATFCPIDLEGIDVTLLSSEEKDFLNQYHVKVYDLISPYLNEDEKIFLAKETRLI